jgi:hypothetical protein
MERLLNIGLSRSLGCLERYKLIICSDGRKGFATRKFYRCIIDKRSTGAAFSCQLTLLTCSVSLLPKGTKAIRESSGSSAMKTVLLCTLRQMRIKINNQA